MINFNFPPPPPEGEEYVEEKRGPLLVNLIEKLYQFPWKGGKKDMQKKRGDPPLR